MMILRIVNPRQGLCGGTHLIITYIGEFVIRAKIIAGSNIGDTALIQRMTLTSKQSKWPFTMKNRQFPIKSCYTMTITKSEGHLINFVTLYFSMRVLSHRLLYVALSKVTTHRGLKILMTEESDKELKHSMRNIVHMEWKLSKTETSIKILSIDNDLRKYCVFLSDSFTIMKMVQRCAILCSRL